MSQLCDAQLMHSTKGEAAATAFKKMLNRVPFNRVTIGYLLTDQGGEFGKQFEALIDAAAGPIEHVFTNTSFRHKVRPCLYMHAHTRHAGLSRRAPH